MLHRTFEGFWQDCPERDTCHLLFHLSDMTLAETNQLPFALLLPLLNAAQPPYIDSDDLQIWMQVSDSRLRNHRDYDLPAIVHADGYMEWWHQGKLHRENGPAVLNPSGRGAWYRHGSQITPGKVTR